MGDLEEQQRGNYWFENPTEPCYEQSKFFLLYNNIEYLEYYEEAMGAEINYVIFENMLLLQEVLYPGLTDKDQYADSNEYMTSQTNQW